ncbi:ECF RNA polymerase sigma factor SigM [Tsuneonella dongtanensis]|uniref:ECF RNA polymerase sigma factor SigM n=1 Tax=Tsuneonella dongtanensis TaxID=692370 RepID=A0A1B2AC89_9SPHN|nr:sigma-70 family RNA polymerase sigma factor [Tsuneonella dongtanensis]ANY19757.1 ECF RNA polymerase sigma factor SigM [Tsuneonella dongtanensis]
MIADEATLAQLMRASQGGDRTAYNALLRECGGWLTRYFRRRVAPEQLDDLVQEVLVSLHAKRASYDPARPFLPWLAAIARYRWVDHLRRVYRNEEVGIEGYEFEQLPEQDAVAARISLDRLFESLPEAQATAIRLVKIQGQPVSDAARICGQSESLVKVNVHRGLKRLAALVEKAN